VASAIRRPPSVALCEYYSMACDCGRLPYDLFLVKGASTILCKNLNLPVSRGLRRGIDSMIPLLVLLQSLSKRNQEWLDFSVYHNIS